ncbi:hypothetical protein [Kallotenue papyrolyticum]|uniref:hypothetical protein n=1 Tax=Kallotenue papyrolyticum TaxID=1325125 RepID=UPI0004786221|nr:hypothetical protein [Kallotenue papyrolyticum]
MLDCRTARDDWQVAPEAAAVREHLASCPRCARYAERLARLDAAARPEVLRNAPPAVTQALLRLAQPAASESRLEAALRQELLLPVPPQLSARLVGLVAEADVPALPSRAEAAVREAVLLTAPPELTARLQALVHAAPPVAQPRRGIVAAVYVATVALLAVALAYTGQLYAFVIEQLGLQAWIAQVATLPGEALARLYQVIPQARTLIDALAQAQQPLQWLLVALLLWAVIDMRQRQQTQPSIERVS